MDKQIFERKYVPTGEECNEVTAFELIKQESYTKLSRLNKTVICCSPSVFIFLKKTRIYKPHQSPQIETIMH